MAFENQAAGQSFTIATETVAGLRDYARLSQTSVWLRIPTAIRWGVGAKVGLVIDVTELGRPLEVVAQVRREDTSGVRLVVVRASLADMIVLNHCLGGTGAHPIAAQAQVQPQTPGADAQAAATALPADESVWGDEDPPAEGDEENIADLLVSDQSAIVSPRVVGIDLGTSNSCIALTDEHGKTRIFKDLNGRSTLPSVVAYMPSGQTLLGFDAVEQLVDQPERTVFGSKRFIGRPFSSEHVQRIIHKFPYKLAPDESHYVGILIDSRIRSPIDVSTRLLRELKDWVERAEGREVVRAVVTVPAYYNDNQRHAVKRAGGRAGLNVERIIDEPTAAAIAFGVAEKNPNMRVLVYDLGGGTFDVSILHIQGSEFRVLATSGDNFLGGEDFDNAIVDYMIKTYEEGYGHNIWSTHPGIRARMRREAERAKHELSAVDQATIAVDNVPLTTQGTTNVRVNLTRLKLEELVSRLVDRTIFYSDMAMREAGLSNQQLDAVLLVGGQTLMPYVRERLRKHFGQLVRDDIDPANAVAAGAALLGQSVERGLPAVSLQSVLPMTIGLASPSDPVFRPLIPRNTPLPVGKTFDVAVPVDQWKRFSYDVFQGDSDEITENEYLGTLSVGDLDPGHADVIGLTVEFELTKECLLKVFITNSVTGARDELLLANRPVAPSVTAKKRQTQPPA